MDELTQLTIVFSVVMLVTLPLCTYAGYRMGYFRGYAAARNLVLKKMTERPLIWSHTGVSEPLSADKVEK